jgi:hypothetical protein
VLETAGAYTVMLFTTEYSIKAFVVDRPVVNNIATTMMASMRVAISIEREPAVLCTGRETP